MLGLSSLERHQAQLRTLLANHFKEELGKSSTTSCPELESQGLNALSLMCAIRDLLITISLGSSRKLTNLILQGELSNSEKILRGYALTFSLDWEDSPLGSSLVRMASRSGGVVSWSQTWFLDKNVYSLTIRHIY